MQARGGSIEGPGASARLATIPSRNLQVRVPFRSGVVALIYFAVFRF